MIALKGKSTRPGFSCPRTMSNRKTGVVIRMQDIIQIKT